MTWEIAEIPVVFQEKKFFWSGKRSGTSAVNSLSVVGEKSAFSPQLVSRSYSVSGPSSDIVERKLCVLEPLGESTAMSAGFARNIASEPLVAAMG